jgi:hypothetical protein
MKLRVASRFDERAAQRMGERRRDFEVGKPADQGAPTGEFDDPVVVGAARVFALVLICAAFDEDELDAVDHPVADRPRLTFDERLQSLQTGELHRAGRVVGEVGCGCAGPRTVDETEACVETDGLDEIQRCFEVGVGFTREADDEIG